MASPNAKTPESNPNAVVGRSVILTAQKPDTLPAESQPVKAGRATRPQRRVPKKTYFDDDNDESISDEVIPDSFNATNEGMPKEKTKTDGLNLLLDPTDPDDDNESKARPKKSLKAQLQPKTQAKPTTRAKTQQAKAKPVPVKTKPKASISRKAKEDEEVDRPPESTADEYEIDASSPDARKKATKKGVRKALISKDKSKGKATKASNVAGKQTAAKVIETVVIESDGSSSYEDDESPIKAAQMQASNRKPLQELDLNEVQKRDRQESLVDDRSVRKPHLVSFDKNGPRNQGVSDSRLAKAASQRHNEAVSRDVSSSHGRVKRSDKSIADSRDGLELKPVNLTFPEPLIEETASGSSSGGDTLGVSRAKRNTAPSSHQPSKSMPKSSQNHKVMNIAPHMNQVDLNLEDDGPDIAHPLSADQLPQYRSNRPATLSHPTPLRDNPTLSPQHQKRRSDLDVTFHRDDEGQRYKRAKLLNPESIVAGSSNQQGQLAWSTDQRLPQPPNAHSSDDPFRAGGIVGNVRTTNFSQRLLSLGSQEGRPNDLGVQRPGALSWSQRVESGRIDGSNRVAERMYQSLGGNKTIDPPRKPKATHDGRAGQHEHASMMGGRVDGGQVSPLQNIGVVGVHGTESGAGSSISSRIVETLHEINNKLLRHLTAKEVILNDVVDDYSANAGDIVRRLTTRHDKEREAVARQFEVRRKDLINTWTATRQDVRSLAEDIAVVDISAIMATIQRGKGLDRLRAVQNE